MGNKENFSPIIKQRVVDLLKDEGRTQKDMATWLDITPEHLSRCLKTGRISRAVLIAIAEYLNCSPEWLSGEQEIAFTYTAFQRKTLDQHRVLTDLYNLLGWDETQLDALTAEEIDSMKADLNAVISYYTLKSRKDGNRE